VDGADVIVCWKHNWPGCPLEVLELSTMTWHLPYDKNLTAETNLTAD